MRIYDWRTNKTAHLTVEEMHKGILQIRDEILLFKTNNPHIFEPFQIIVVKDDGTEVDLCDIHQPLEKLMAEASE